MNEHERVKGQRLAEGPWFVFPLFVYAVKNCDSCGVDDGDGHRDCDIKSIIIKFGINPERPRKRVVCGWLIQNLRFG